MITLQHTRTAPVLREPAIWAGLQFLALGVVGVTTGLGPLGWAAGLAYGFATWAFLGYGMQRHRTRSLGPADRVTLARGLMVGAVTALVADRAGQDVPVALVVTLAAVALSLDWVDGQVARRTGTSTALGARFDMEVDAFLILVLSAYVAVHMGPWVLAIGLMRYAFVAASWRFRWMNAPLPASYARKVVAAVQGIFLVVAASGLLPFATVLVGLALASLVWSFGRDVLWLWREASVSVGGSRHV
ncbi:CDP-alcohol phosphatidyltransferase family protein [Lentzea sp. BCCO 10_0856]|uniref:CDP-alcohol phosphatidyltransferase family protein n=1 Tax=Lentzea miocenica TaxID=3095431 RepID=A0ABU4T404_9PSEU|nr:CDP-alcohol phosphatidyltransferase family protein [Lentzea sp. BCCO 10_0856]MDX8032887.1 CDP-alcohol phosphatidyltransferase family protein [Lentzea sp. BCCO 10_0856]